MSLFLLCAPTSGGRITPCSAMSESSKPSLGRQMQALLVILASRAATSCLFFLCWKEQHQSNIPVVVTPLLPAWICGVRLGFSKGPTDFTIQQDLDAKVEEFQLAIL